MKHKKPKTSTKKKAKGRQQKKLQVAASSPVAPIKTPSIDELIEAGDIATGAQKTEQALEIFLSAESLLLRNGDDDVDDTTTTKPTMAVTTTTTTTTTEEEEEERKAKLIYVLEKMGEQKASLGDHAAAKHDFERAIQLLIKSASSNNNNNKLTEQQQTAQYHESLAALHLYVGQLCSDHEALEAYKKGLQSLERGLELRQQEYDDLINSSQQQQVEETNRYSKTNDSSMMEMETGTMSKSDEAKVLLEEARCVLICVLKLNMS